MTRNSQTKKKRTKTVWNTRTTKPIQKKKRRRAYIYGGLHPLT